MAWSSVDKTKCKGLIICISEVNHYGTNDYSKFQHKNTHGNAYNILKTLTVQTCFISENNLTAWTWSWYK